MSETATETPAAPASPEPAQQQPPAESARQPASAPAELAQPAASGQEPGAEPAPEPGSVDQLPPWAQKLIRDTRSDAAGQRAKAKEQADALAALEQKSQAQLDGIARALGLKPEEATPEQIMAERDAANAERDAEKARARATQVELAVFRAAAAQDANGDALLDSRSFVAKLAGLDPQADGFGQQVSELIRTAAEEDSRYKAAPPLAADPPKPRTEPAVPKSGGEFTGPPSQPRQLTEEDAKAMSASEVADAIDKGLFSAAGYGPRRKSRR